MKERQHSGLIRWIFARNPLLQQQQLLVVAVPPLLNRMNRTVVDYSSPAFLT